MNNAQSARHRLQAIQAGETVYYGKVCKHGHPGMRYTANRVCIDCHSDRHADQPYDRAKGAAAKRAYRERKRLGAAMLDDL